MAAKLRLAGSPLRSFPTLLTIAVVLGINAFVIGVGGWHFWRYVVAPKVGALDEADRWKERLQIATSAFRTIDEKQVALEAMAGQAEYVATLSEPERRRVARALDNVILMIEYPLDLKYAAARVQAMLLPSAAPVEMVPSATTAASSPIAVAVDPVRELRRLTALVGPAFREASAARTRLLVEAVRREPCRRELAEIVVALEAREDLGTVERSFLYGIRNEQEHRCSW